MKKVIQPETRDNVFPDHKFVSNKNQLKAAVTTFVENNAVEWEKVKDLDKDDFDVQMDECVENIGDAVARALNHVRNQKVQDVRRTWMDSWLDGDALEKMTAASDGKIRVIRCL